MLLKKFILVIIAIISYFNIAQKLIDVTILGDLKASVENYINRLLAPIIKALDTPELKKLTNLAYPSPSAKKSVEAQAQSENSPDKMELKVGKVLEAIKHPDADSLCVLKIEIGKDITKLVRIIVPQSF